MFPTKRRGFTLIELLVVIAIIAILMALLLPAVQKVREAANRMVCANNLKQVGLALHNYHNDHLRFPAGYNSAAAEVNGEGTGPGWGWCAQLLPYLEQDALHRQIRFDQDILASIHLPVRERILKSFLCPSDAVDRPIFEVPSEGGAPLTRVAFGNYVGMAGTHEVTGLPDTNNGTLFRNSRIRIADLHDGSSNTVVATERESQRSPMTTWVGAITHSVNPPLNPAYEEEGPGTLVLTNTGEAADGRVPNNNLGHVEDASSKHPAGVNMLMGDGSVRMFQNTIKPAVWEALGTRSGVEVVELE
jgi:prepilin-type N-terminal cleavage/methylation domain-containing protein/prepilin-type processing-associated H-X9-DG protein